MPAKAAAAFRDPDLIARRAVSVRAALRRPEIRLKVGEASRLAQSAMTPEQRRKKSEAISASLTEYWAAIPPEKRRSRNLPWIEAGHAASADLMTSSIEESVAAELDRRGEWYARHRFIGPYIVDFVFYRERVILECDGDYWHSRPGVPEYDERRDEFHRIHGWLVVRLTETEIRQNVSAAVSRALSIWRNERCDPD
jgi:very-short-patch-repair endonuclease